MATIYNKTALKKIKKDELIQMFLDQQAEKNDFELWYQEIHNGNIKGFAECGKKITDLQQENKKLKEFKGDVINALQFDDDLDDEDYISSIKDMEQHYDIEHEEIIEENKRLKEGFKKANEENEKLKEQNNKMKEGFKKLKEISLE